MIEVLPTDWSPRKTSLYFARGAREVLEVLGVLLGPAGLSPDVDGFDDVVADGDSPLIPIKL
jgi:hypothetical protein